VAWSIYQRIIAAHSHPDRRRGKTAMATVIDPQRAAVPAGLKSWPNSAEPGSAETPTCCPSTTTPPTDPPKPSTDAWKRYAATLSASPLTEPDPYCTAAPTQLINALLKPEEPANHQDPDSPGNFSPQRTP
jgi:transposase